MRPSIVRKVLTLHIKNRVPVMLHGGPGAGKSGIVFQTAEELGLKVIDLRLSQLDTVDLRGIPNVVKGATVWNPPSMFPRTAGYLLFLDELNSASPEMQAAAYQLINDRRIGDYVLPPDCAIVGAGNRLGDRAIVTKLSSALANRMAHIDYEINNDDWCEWAVKKGIHPHIVSFVRWRPSALNEFDPRNSSAEEAKRVAAVRTSLRFCTPRSWEKVSISLGSTGDEELLAETIPTIIGDAGAVEFQAFRKVIANMPDLDKILKSPKSAPLPAGLDIRMALTTSLSMKCDRSNFVAGLTYVERFGSLEHSTYFMRDLASRDMKITHDAAYTKWLIDNSSTII